MAVDRISTPPRSLPPSVFFLAYITGALWAKRGERDILREARDEGRRKNKATVALFTKVQLRGYKIGLL